MKALSLAVTSKPLLVQDGAEKTWEVLGVFEQACNLLDSKGSVLVLVLPRVGNGPFSVVVPESAGGFDWVKPGAPIQSDEHAIRSAAWHIDLQDAHEWDPYLPAAPQTLGASSEAHLALADYRDWAHLAGPTDDIVTKKLFAAAQSLRLALETGQDAAYAAGRLAGLGRGLTPAGDDYLVGVMAALTLKGEEWPRRQIGRGAANRTTSLSQAFLAAATEGCFTEPWHRLAQALADRDLHNIRQALENIASHGMTSGRDALAGFADVMLGLSR